MYFGLYNIVNILKEIDNNFVLDSDSSVDALNVYAMITLSLFSSLSPIPSFFGLTNTSHPTLYSPLATFLIYYLLFENLLNIILSLK